MKKIDKQHQKNNKYLQNMLVGEDLQMHLTLKMMVGQKNIKNLKVY